MVSMIVAVRNFAPSKTSSFCRSTNPSSSALFNSEIVNKIANLQNQTLQIALFIANNWKVIYGLLLFSNALKCVKETSMLLLFEKNTNNKSNKFEPGKFLFCTTFPLVFASLTELLTDLKRSTILTTKLDKKQKQKNSYLKEEIRTL